MNKDTALRLDELKHWLWYEPETGIFRWRYGTRNKTKKPWDVAGCKSNTGYVHITLKNKTYRAHRLAWMYMTGNEPDALIDHVNQDKTDNRWSNLRTANAKQNQWNTAIRIDNKSGIKGIHFCKTWERWIASVRVNGVRHHIGRYENLNEATSAVIEFRKKHHGEYAS